MTSALAPSRKCVERSGTATTHTRTRVTTRERIVSSWNCEEESKRPESGAQIAVCMDAIPASGSRPPRCGCAALSLRSSPMTPTCGSTPAATRTSRHFDLHAFVGEVRVRAMSIGIVQH
eukprot:1763797-Rhodomonas_salina.3